MFNIYCICIRTRGGIYSKIWPETEGAAQGKCRSYFTVYPDFSPNTHIITFPNKDSSVAVVAVPGFSFGLDIILFVSWKILHLRWILQYCLAASWFACRRHLHSRSPDSFLRPRANKHIALSASSLMSLHVMWPASRTHLVSRAATRRCMASLTPPN